MVVLAPKEVKHGGSLSDHACNRQRRLKTEGMLHPLTKLMVVFLDADAQNLVYALLEYRYLDILLVFQDLIGWFEEQTEKTLLLVCCGPYLRER